MTQRIPLTREGYEALKAELKRLRQQELPQVIRAIEEARAHGDLSENAEYHAAKERNAIISAKINELETVLAAAEVIDPLPEPNGRVVFGATVTVYDADTDQELRYQIVGGPESDASKGRISISSPIAQALLGRREGDEVQVRTPGGVRTLEIISIE